MVSTPPKSDLTAPSSPQAAPKVIPPVLPQVQGSDFLPPISRWSTWGGLSIVAGLGIAVAIASATNYNVTIKAQANIRPDGELRLVQAATDGWITRISIAENQVVRKGEIIATIDDSRLQTQKSQLQSSLQQAQLQLGQINAQIRSLDNQVAAETERINRSVISAKAELTLSQRKFQDLQLTTQSELRETEAALELAKKDLVRFQSLANTGAIAEGQIDTKIAALKTATAKWERAKANINPSGAEVAIATERIAKEQAMGSSSLASINKEREALIQQRIEIQKQLQRDRRELQQVQQNLSQTQITAPTAGTVLKLNLRNSNQTVRSGEEIAQIVPSNTKLVIKAMVAAQDISKVEIGQKAQMRVSACPYPDFGTLKGQVKAIAPDAIATSTNSNQLDTSNRFYEVTVQPERLTLGEGDRQCQIQFGMEGRIDIISKEETALQFILRKARLLTDF
jgi:HlyD family type I secretion membrane fusion protein